MESKFSKYAEPILGKTYLVKFGEPNANGEVYTKESFKQEQVNEAIKGVQGIRAFSIDDIGLEIVYAINEFKLPNT